MRNKLEKERLKYANPKPLSELEDHKKYFEGLSVSLFHQYKLMI